MYTPVIITSTLLLQTNAYTFKISYTIFPSIYSPYRSFSGPKGGIRSQLPVDQGHLTVHFNSVLTCVNATAWESNDAQVRMVVVIVMVLCMWR